MRGSTLVVCLAVACGGAPPRPARPAACAVDGTWVGRATDPAGVAWQLTMVLHQDGRVVAGTTEWQGDDGRRVIEDVRGEVACADGVIELRAVLSEPGADEPAAPTAYRLELAGDDAAVTGRFESESGRPGTLTARRRPR